MTLEIGVAGAIPQGGFDSADQFWSDRYAIRKISNKIAQFLSLFALDVYAPQPGASLDVLERRAQYGGRKGRSARKRLARHNAPLARCLRRDEQELRDRLLYGIGAEPLIPGWEGRSI